MIHGHPRALARACAHPPGVSGGAPPLLYEASLFVPDQVERTTGMAFRNPRGV